MNPVEFFLGTRVEKSAQKSADKLSHRAHLSNAEQAQLEGFQGITRRRFLRRAAAAGVIATGTALGIPLLLLSNNSTDTSAPSRNSQTQPRNEVQTPAEPFSDPELQKIAREIRLWTLADGTSVTRMFPEAEHAAIVLSGKTDLKSFIPIANSRLLFTNNAPDAAFDMYHEEQSGTDTKALINLPPGTHFPTGAEINYKWRDNQRTIATLKLPADVQNSTIRMPVAAKEASQVYDMLSYYQLYLQLAQEQGLEFTVVNPDNIVLSEAEKIANIAEDTALLEKTITGEDVSFLESLIDFGSHIRVGGILFANWYQDQLNRGINPVETSQIKYGKNMVGLLESKNVIKRQGNLWVWTSGAAPEIDSPRFLQLFREISLKSTPHFD